MGIVEYENAYYLIGGETSSGIDGAVLRFDAAKNAWQAMADKPTRVTDVQAMVLGEKIYVPGGRLEDGRSSDTLEVYNPREDAWESKASLPEQISAYALAAFEGKLYLFGGRNGEQYLSTVYVYSPQEDRWQERTGMSAPRALAGAAVGNGKIYVIGGYDGSHALDQNQAYFPTRDGGSENPWEDLAPLPARRYAMGVTSVASSIYLLGGLDEAGKPADPVGLSYLAQANQWNTFDAPPVEVGAQPALLSSGNYLTVLGGETPQGLSASNLSYQAIYTITVPILQSDGGH
jgi:N-acetylneuraminic acid mutarotase